jgi:hypothetical protein
MHALDHLVYATPDLATSVEELARRLGVRASAGGQHPGGGTHNALLSLGKDAYLEVIGPDPAQAPPTRPRAFGLDRLRSPRLQTWAVRCADLERLMIRARAIGLELERIDAGGRRRPDGVELSWRYAGIRADRMAGVIPFFIDWGDSPHPSRSAAGGVSFVSLLAQHPEPERVRAIFDALELPARVERGDRPNLIATLRTPNGEVELS